MGLGLRRWLVICRPICCLFVYTSFLDVISKEKSIRANKEKNDPTLRYRIRLGLTLTVLRHIVISEREKSLAKIKLQLCVRQVYTHKQNKTQHDFVHD